MPKKKRAYQHVNLKGKSDENRFIKKMLTSHLILPVECVCFQKHTLFLVYNEMVH